MSRALSTPARLGATVVAGVAIASLGAQGIVSYGLNGSVGATLWALASYFTVLTNLLVALTFVAISARWVAAPAPWLAGVTLWIVAVGVVYHLILAQLWAPVGLAWWADQGLHSAVPTLTLLWWLVFAPNAGLKPHHAMAWLGWPLLYTAYALVRGAWSGAYPYPFLDVTALGYGGVSMNGAGLALGFFLGGLALVGSAKALTR
jgi:hypothetical protein